MTDDIIDSICSTCSKIFAPFFQWERLRSPLAGWARIGLAVILPFIIWSHDWLLVGLWAMAFFSHPYWFPVCVDAGEDRHFLTKIVDALQGWMEKTPAAVKFYEFFPCTFLFIPLVGSFWAHHLFWGIYFLLAVIMQKGFFLKQLLQENDDAESAA